jgi:molybdopterin-guanine dinucleotide biosynthesis protein A
MLRRERQPIAAAILAGGQARRMAGANKATLRIGTKTIIDRQLALVRQVADPVFIVSGRPDTWDGVAATATIVPDILPGAGPLGGIYTALVSSPHPRALVIACDMPFLTLRLLEMLTRDSDADLVIPRSARGYEPLCATWSTACATAVRRRIEEGRLKAALVVEDLRVEEIGPDSLAACDPDGLLFVNVNTPHDYEQAQEVSRQKPTT